MTGQRVGPARRPCRVGSRPRRGGGRGAFTLTEAVVAVAVSALVVGILMALWASSRRQEQQLLDRMDMGRGVRASLARVQYDLRELLEIDRLDRDDTGTLKVMEFKVPAGPQLTASILYEFDRDTHRFRRNKTDSFAGSVRDFQIFPYTLENPPREIKEESELSLIQLLKIRLTFVPGKSEFQNAGEPRTFTFTIYPRVPASRWKSVAGRFGLSGGRFGRTGGVGPLPDQNQ